MYIWFLCKDGDVTDLSCRFVDMNQCGYTDMSEYDMRWTHYDLSDTGMITMLLIFNFSCIYEVHSIKISPDPLLVIVGS